MAIGPVQLVVVAFDDHGFGEMGQALERLRGSDAVGVVDALALYKDAEGAIEVEPLAGPPGPGAPQGAIARLIGLEIQGAEPPPAPEGGALTEPAEGSYRALGERDVWDVIGEIPNDSAALLLLVEHRWAVPLREAMVRAGGFRIADGFISPLDLADVGLISAREAQRLHALETAGGA